MGPVVHQIICSGQSSSRWCGVKIPTTGPAYSKRGVRTVEDQRGELHQHVEDGMAWKLGEGVPVQVSSSSSDRGSKFRGPSQNSSRVATKRDVIITKPIKSTITL
ncbi:hypothetical protein AVEN_129735-1 [Araneus ventricosus]|uniref:Uncharacterized protein n=1 Tax=Araneus ventricosus TaxID=182803 RepID=A0A4Y2JCS4_ARAVE|nr:hypothetical protein AVEN_129735-1 [Araneus ventricosus]